jgi:hypothetical protein
MPISGSHSYGPWRLTKPDWRSPWIATNTDNQEVRHTGHHNLNDAIATLTDPTPTPQPGTYTIAPGSRARCGHQRYPGTGLLERVELHPRRSDHVRVTVYGYDYKAQHWCDECLRQPALTGAAHAGTATIWGDAGTTEDILDEWASAQGIDRDDEASFDQSEFPKRVTEDQAHQDCTPANGYPHGTCGDRCERCGNPLGYSCPNITEDPA